MAYLLLADAVNSTKTLLEAVRIPREVVVDHEIGVLEVYAFTCSVGGEEDANDGIRAKSSWRLRRSSRWVPPWME